MHSSHPSLLIQKLVTTIERHGPITFRDFMEAALYDPEYGYYMTAGPRIGKEGDYFTSPDVHPIFGTLIGRQLAQVAEAVAPGGEFMVVEQGAGKGLLARHLLDACKRDAPQLLARTRYIIVERSPEMAQLQRGQLRSFLEDGIRITWHADLAVLPQNSLVGAFISNELVDAFPVHRVVRRPLGLREIFVGWSPPDGEVEGRFIEIEAPPCERRLENHLSRLGISLEIGQRAEVNFQALDWITHVARILKRGIVLTIDYGHTASDLYAPMRRDGTLMCYTGHRACESPYENVGRQDLTAHVNFTDLALAGREAGLEVTGFTNQLHFLMGLGIEAAFGSAAAQECDAMRNLIRPDGMGTTYKVLVQHKGLPAPVLDGLRSRPFYHDALYAGVPGGGKGEREWEAVSR
ncbi:MAG: hypothetical protein E6K60_12010 [Nitrospirae bacterium]|nr:MAG: hypothetical protein E6K60_12010 [Nitrospirota bacterium]